MSGLTEAAVLIPLSGDRIVFTVRADDLPSHAGHVSFPGGKHEPRDRSLRETALREAEEEVALGRDAVEITRDLPAHETVTTGFRIKPFVGRVPLDYGFEPNDEVDELLAVPIPALENRYERDGDRVRYPCGDHTVWGVTARILTTLLVRDYGLSV